MVSPALTISESRLLESIRNLGRTGTHKMACHLPPHLGPSTHTGGMTQGKAL